MYFDIYIRSSKNNPDIEIWSQVSVRDFIASAKQIDKALSKASFNVDPALITEMGDGTNWYSGDMIKISFQSDELSSEDFAFLKSIATDNLDVVFLDNEGSIVYGCKKIAMNVQPITPDQSKLIQIAGSREGIENLIFYRIKPFSVTISFPRHGFIYNSNISQVTGTAL